jgi:hypothetical protein
MAAAAQATVASNNAIRAHLKTTRTVVSSLSSSIMCKHQLIIATLISSSSFCFSPNALALDNPEKPIGKIKWEIRDGWDVAALSTGEKTLFAKDVQIMKHRIKMFDLDKTYYFRYEETMASDRVGNGFGFRCGRNDQKTFSWEWFTIDRIGHAKKLQETGELLFKTTKSSKGSEISRMEFPTDISYRIIREGEWNPFNTTWRIKVLKGSFIDWPCSEKAATKASSAPNPGN